MARRLTIHAPIAGTVVGLSEVGDEVFAGHLVGTGLAIDPDPGTHVVAPVSGVIASALPHAFVVECEPGRGVLVHLGVDTVSLRGAGFFAQVEVGEQVSVGDVVVRWDPGSVTRAGLSALCPVVALQAPAESVRWLVSPGARVRAGDPVLSWTPGASI